MSDTKIETISATTSAATPASTMMTTPMTALDVREALLEEIREWLDQWKHLPPQGSPGWHLLRIFTVGGSELKKLLDDESAVVALKAGIRTIPSMLAMNWGSVLEPIMRQLSSRIFQTPVYEASSIPSIEVKGKTFSLDGLGVVRMVCSSSGGGGEDGGNKTASPRHHIEYLKALFEYKLLWSRGIIHGDVFPEYVPQVKSGMSDLGIPDIAIYMEGVLRVCSIDQMNFTSTINTSLHKSYSSKTCREPKTLAVGFMLVSIPDEKKDVPNGSIYKWLREKETDFGMLETQRELNNLLAPIRAGYFNAHFGKFSMYGDRVVDRVSFLKAQKITVPNDKPADVFEEYKRVREAIPKGERYIGILPLKLLDINIVPVEKEVGYTKQFETEITQCLEKCKQLCSIENMGERTYAYHKMYPRDYDFAVPENVSSIDGYY